MNMFVVEEFMRFRFPATMNQVHYTQFGTNMNGDMTLSSAGAKMLFRVSEKLSLYSSLIMGVRDVLAISKSTIIIGLTRTTS
jgi:hypothetical protein